MNEITPYPCPKGEKVSKSCTYNELWTNLLAGTTPGSREVHHHQLISCFLQDGFEFFLQKNAQTTRRVIDHLLIDLTSLLKRVYFVSLDPFSRWSEVRFKATHFHHHASACHIKLFQTLKYIPPIFNRKAFFYKIRT